MNSEPSLHSVRRVLVIRVGHLGDSVMATTIIEPERQLWDRTPAQKRCAGNRCMSGLRPDAVFAALHALATRNSGAAVASPGAGG